MQIKFINLNLWNGGYLFDNLIDFIKIEKPDILACQEVFNGKKPNLESRYKSYNLLTDLLNFKYSSFSPAFLGLTEMGKIDNGNAVFSGYPIKKTKTVFYDIAYGERDNNRKNFPFSPRNLQSVEIKLGNVPLHIFNTHGIWGEDGNDNIRRLKMSKTIVNEIKDKKYVILSGDFNTQEKTRTIANIEKHLTNVFKGELQSTFNMKRKDDPRYAKAVVDMVFVSNNIKVLKHTCPQVDISDHLPLVCVFEI